jgi:Secretion system C-terminal sorting domain
MLRTPTILSAFRKFALTISLATCLPFLAKADLGITVVTTQVGNQVTADFLVYNFDDIVSFQYTIQWDPAVLQFESVGDFNLPGMTLDYFGLFQIEEGKLLGLWYNPDGLTGLSLPSCTTIYRAHFISLNGQVPPITITGDPLLIEVTNYAGEYLDIEQGLDCNSLSRISGKIFKDEDGDCSKDEAEAALEDWTVKLQTNGTNHYVSAPNGEYVYHGMPGEYAVTAISPENNYLEVCQPTANISLGENQQLEQNFGTVVEQGPSFTTGKTLGNFAVEIAPNPAQSNQAISIETTSETARALTLQLFDMSGRLLRKWAQEVQPGTTNSTVSPSLETGLYLLKITDENGDTNLAKLVIY